MTPDNLPLQIEKYYQDRNIKVLTYRMLRTTPAKIKVIKEGDKYDVWQLKYFDWMLKLQDIQISTDNPDGFSVLTFYYGDAKTDSTPVIVYFGRYTHQASGNPLVCGINVNYLSVAEMEELKAYLPKIMHRSKLSDRYDEARVLIPEIIRRAYRTYNDESIYGLKESIFPFKKPENS